MTVIVRATVFGTFRGAKRQDAVAFLAPYKQQDVMKFDPHKAAHRRRIGYAFVVMFFSCRVRQDSKPAPVTKDLALIEELWHLPCREQADMADNCGVEYLYRVGPRRIYYVIEVNRILAPAVVTQDTHTPTIPRGMLPTDRVERNLKYDQAKADAKGVPGSGSQVYRVDTIKMKWGVAHRQDADPGSDSDEAQ